MNQPRSPNPALAGRQPGQQQQQQPQQPQQPQQQQPPGSAGLLGPNGQPIQAEYIDLRINAGGFAIQTPSMDSAQLVQHIINPQTGAAQIPYHMVITWVEIVHALAQRDAVIEWLLRRLDDVENAMGKPGISYEAFMHEMQQQFAAMTAAAAAAAGAPPAGDPPR